MLDNKKEQNYNLFSNICYILKKQWNFNKKSLIAPIVRIPAGVLVSLIGIILPKIVLDTIENHISVELFLIRIVPMITLFAVISYANYCSNISMKRCADRMRFLCYVKQINDKAIKEDYDIFVSPEGKNIRKKAEISVGYSGGSGVNNFFPSLTELLKDTLGFISYCAIIMALNPWIIVVLIMSYIIDGVAAMVVERWIHKNKNRRALIQRQLNYVAYRTRTLSASKDIKMYGMAAWLNEVSKMFLNKGIELYKEIEAKKFAQLIFEGILIFLRNGLAYAYLIHLIVNGNMSIGNFAMYFSAISGFGDWLQNIITLVSDFADANYYVADYRTFIDSPDHYISLKKIDISTIRKPYTIVLEDVSYIYPESDKIILDNINLEIRNGERLAIVGNNGAGKTTLIKLICGLLTPTKGRVLINGIDVKKIESADYYKLFSAVFQDIGIIPVSIAKNIALCVEEKIDEKRVWNCLDIAGLSERIKRLPDNIHTNLVKNVADNAIELSKGEMQKLLLARAIYKNSSIMILDEPTASLDPIAENEVYLKYNEIVKEKIAIFISHRLSSTRFCDRIIFLKNSKIVETGAHDELIMQNGEYAKMFKLQSYYYNNYAFEEM